MRRSRCFYISCHGDLSRFNIMVDHRTLVMMCIYDWEHAGNFPPYIELPLWRFDDNDGYKGTFMDKAKIEEEITLLQ
ncbi:hypothetical protein F4778DRAFT_753727 [Xylariomycetidae sp. FL2044]|nr:hypothetical protein F4778DRAFT_753727 [Xylariomycetidae sp. FL2044]